jgi:hypothetical protein
VFGSWEQRATITHIQTKNPLHDIPMDFQGSIPRLHRLLDFHLRILAPRGDDHDAQRSEKKSQGFHPFTIISNRAARHRRYLPYALTNAPKQQHKMRNPFFAPKVSLQPI